MTTTTQQNYSNLLLKLKETETENDYLKKEIKRLKLEQQTHTSTTSHWNTNLKELLTLVEQQIDSLTSTNRLTYDIYQTVVNLIWKSFSYECASSHVKEINLRVRDKLNKKLSSLSHVDEFLSVSKTYLYDLNFLAHESAILKEKIASQNVLIQSVIKSFNEHWSSSKQNLNSTNSFSALSSINQDQTATSNEVDDVDDFNDYHYDSPLAIQTNHRSNLSNKPSRQYFVCPKCEVAIDKRQVTYTTFEQHVYKCEPSKLVCIFCFEIFDSNKEAEFNQHIQRHLRLVESDTNSNETASSTKNKEDFNLPEYQANSSSGMIISRSESNTSSANVSSNLVSSLSSRSNSNIEISNSTDSTDLKVANMSVPQQLQQQPRSLSSKPCLLIQNFEPKIRKRL